MMVALQIDRYTNLYVELSIEVEDMKYTIDLSLFCHKNMASAIISTQMTMATALAMLLQGWAFQ